MRVAYMAVAMPLVSPSLRARRGIEMHYAIASWRRARIQHTSRRWLALIQCAPVIRPMATRVLLPHT
jgi:hypothetical protein